MINIGSGYPVISLRRMESKGWKALRSYVAGAKNIVGQGGKVFVLGWGVFIINDPLYAQIFFNPFFETENFLQIVTLLVWNLKKDCAQVLCAILEEISLMLSNYSFLWHSPHIMGPASLAL